MILLYPPLALGGFYLHVFNERGLWLPYPPTPDPADLFWGGTRFSIEIDPEENDWWMLNIEPRDVRSSALSVSSEEAADVIAGSLAQDGSVPSDDTATVLLDLARAGLEAEFKALARMTNGAATESEVDTLWQGTRRRLGKKGKAEC